MGSKVFLIEYSSVTFDSSDLINSQIMYKNKKIKNIKYWWD